MPVKRAGAESTTRADSHLRPDLAPSRRRSPSNEVDANQSPLRWNTEPPRDSRRLHSVRGWGHGQTRTSYGLGCTEPSTTRSSDRMKPDVIVPIFLGTWISLGIATWLFYWRGSFEAKRRWHPWIAFGMGAVFALFVGLMTNIRVLLFFGPAAMLIAFWNWRSTSSCPVCGRTLIRPPPWTRMSVCRKCGARLDGSAMPPNKPL